MISGQLLPKRCRVPSEALLMREKE